MTRFSTAFFLIGALSAIGNAMCLPQYEYRTITLVEGQGVETPLGTFYVTTPGRIGTVDRYGHVRRGGPHETAHMDALCAERFGDEFEYTNVHSGTRHSQNIGEYLVDGVNLLRSPFGRPLLSHDGNTRHYSCHRLLPDEPPICNNEENTGLSGAVKAVTADPD